MTRPRVVVVELCVSRLNILRFDEQTILEEAKNLNMGMLIFKICNRLLSAYIDSFF